MRARLFVMHSRIYAMNVMCEVQVVWLMYVMRLYRVCNMCDVDVREWIGNISYMLNAMVECIQEHVSQLCLLKPFHSFTRSYFQTFSASLDKQISTSFKC